MITDATQDEIERAFCEWWRPANPVSYRIAFVAGYRAALDAARPDQGAEEKFAAFMDDLCGPTAYARKAKEEQQLRTRQERGVPEGWRPIETAPKDGCVILICTKYGDRYTGNWAGTILDPVTWRDWGSRKQIAHPTMWMPLPPPPASPEPASPRPDEAADDRVLCGRPVSPCTDVDACPHYSAIPEPDSPPRESEDRLVDYYERQIEWSRKTFGPGRRTGGVTEHIEKELAEVRAKPDDLSEWVDIIILAMDGYWRHGGTAASFMPDLLAKQRKNFARQWPAPTSEDRAVEHVRPDEALSPSETPADEGGEDSLPEPPSLDGCAVDLTNSRRLSRPLAPEAGLAETWDAIRPYINGLCHGDDFFAGPEAQSKLRKARDRMNAVARLRPAPASEGPLREVLANLLDHVDRNTCTHEETHRGGAIWTICDGCGAKWADDKGGFSPHEDAPAVAAARDSLRTLSQQPAGEEG